ncbi:MAG: precorrin-6y C5,15-methyltransferase (decarboxylating) subunit CbiE [Bacilli bacterium]
MNKLYIIGYGMGDDKLLCDDTKEIINLANCVLTTSRIGNNDSKFEKLNLTQIYERLSMNLKGTTVLLVSGDVGFFSVSRTIYDKFSKMYKILLINGFSSLQYFSAKLGFNYDDAKVISVHGRDINIIGAVVYNFKVFVLTGGKSSVNEVAKKLCKYGLENVMIYVGENLSYKNESIINGTALELSRMEFDDLSVMYIINENFITNNTTMFDKEFIRSSIPMTKEEIRWVCIQKLCLNSQDIVFDIGSGTGSIAIESARRVYDGFVYAIETNQDACNLIKENISKHRTFNIEVVNNMAPDNFEKLQMPNKAIIGGSKGNIKMIINALLRINPKIKIVVNAITIETLSTTIDCFKSNNLYFDCICMNVSKSKELSKYNMMIANNPVYIITGIANE